MLTVDLHIHTKYSDGKLPLNKVIDLYGNAGYDAIAITDHLCVPKNILGIGAKYLQQTLNEKTWPGYINHISKEANRAWREYKMIVYPGVEYSHNTFKHSRNAHILAIDVRDYISPLLNEVEWLNEVRKRGALTVAAHPLKLRDASSQTYYLIENKNIFSPLIDLWEVANHRTLWRDMFKHDFSLLATSDFHGPSNWAAWRTRIDCEKDPQAIKKHLLCKNSKREFVFIYGSVNEVKSLIRRTSTGGQNAFDSTNIGINSGWAAQYA